MMYSHTTNYIKVNVQPMFLDDQSHPETHEFVWAYHVRIENQGKTPVRLVNRYWRITDSFGKTQEVRGPGVVGEQPVLYPGEAFEYTSGAPLKTPSGIMEGNYEMEHPDGNRFQITIPTFSLDSPFSMGTVH